jgi:hypothetical protein
MNNAYLETARPDSAYKAFERSRFRIDVQFDARFRLRNRLETLDQHTVAERLELLIRARRRTTNKTQKRLRTDLLIQHVIVIFL